MADSSESFRPSDAEMSARIAGTAEAYFQQSLETFADEFNYLTDRLTISQSLHRMSDIIVAGEKCYPEAVHWDALREVAVRGCVQRMALEDFSPDTQIVLMPVFKDFVRQIGGDELVRDFCGRVIRHKRATDAMLDDFEGLPPVSELAA